MEVRPFHSDDEPAVVALWVSCGLVRPWNNPSKDIRRKLADSPTGFFVGVEDGRVVASVMVGYEGHRGWINYLAVAPDCQRRGLGRTMMAEAERYLGVVGCPKVNLLVRAGNANAVAFYRQLGFVVDEVVCLGKRLERDEPPYAEPESGFPSQKTDNSPHG